jgi:hypothetical protein
MQLARCTLAVALFLIKPHIIMSNHGAHATHPCQMRLQRQAAGGPGAAKTAILARRFQNNKPFLNKNAVDILVKNMFKSSCHFRFLLNIVLLRRNRGLKKIDLSTFGGFY